MDFERFELSKWLFTTLLGNYQSRLSPTDSAEEANYKGWDALRLSWKIVHRHWFKNFLVMLCWWLISFAGVLACCVGLVVSVPFALTTFSGVYLGIFEQLEPRASTS